MTNIVRNILVMICTLLCISIIITADEDISDDPNCVRLNHQCTEETDICCQNETTALGPDAFSEVICNYRAEFEESRCQEIIHYDQYIPADYPYDDEYVEV